MTDITNTGMDKETEEQFNVEVETAKAAIHAALGTLMNDHTATALSGTLAISLTAVEVAYAVGTLAKMPHDTIADMVGALCCDMMAHLDFMFANEQTENSDARLMEVAANA